MFGPDPDQNPWIQALQTLGATLQTAGAGFSGRQNDALPQLLAQQQQRRSYQALQQAVLGDQGSTQATQAPIPGSQGEAATPGYQTPAGASAPLGMIGGVSPQLMAFLQAPGGDPALKTQLLVGALTRQQAINKVDPGQNLVRDDGTVVYSAPALPNYGDVGHGINPTTGKLDSYVIDSKTAQQKWLNTTPPPNIDVVNGQVIDKNAVAPGTVIPQQGEAPRSPERLKQDIELANIGKTPPLNATWDEPKTVEVTDANGKTDQITAQQNKVTGQWGKADTNHTPIDTTGGVRILNASQLPGGGRVAGQTGRVTGAAELVTTALENLSQLPATSSFGLLGNAAQPATIRGALARAVTPEESQMYQTVSKGVSRGLSALEAEGLAPSGTFTNQLEGLTIQAGDTGANAMLKLAEQRQAAESSLQAIQKGPLLTKAQQEEVAGLRDRLKAAIPWTPKDIITLTNSKNPATTFKEMAAKMGIGTQAPQNNSDGTPAPSAPTATGPNGQKLILQNGQWVPVK